MPFNVGEDVLPRAAPPLRRRDDAPRFQYARFFRRFVGIFPQPGQQALLRPAAEGHPALMEDEVHRPLLHPAGLLGGLDGEGIDFVLSQGGAEARRRAPVAQGCAVGQAHGCPQLHHGLVEGARHGGGDNLLQCLPHPLLGGGEGDVPLVPGDAGHHPEHVAVHRRNGDAEGDGGDGTRRVLPHSGQSEQFLIAGGNGPAVPLHHLSGGLFQVAGTAVIPQPLPELHQGVVLHCRQGGHVGQGLHKTAVIAHHSGHPGLLEHNLADPDVIGGGIAPPGQHPGVLVVPGQQGDGQLFQFSQG